MTDLSLWDVFKLLWPDFGALFRGELAGLNALFIVLIIGVFGWFLLLLFGKRALINGRLTQLNKLVEGQTQKELVAARQATKDDAENSRDPLVQHLWREFDETLVESPDGHSLWNTIDAEQFFNTETIARDVVHNRVLEFIPSALTALGVLGTFVGLTTGLSGLDMRTDSSIVELTDGVNTLIKAATIAFMTSVWGVLLSLVSNLMRKFVERRLVKNVAEFQNVIDRLYKKHAPEQSLVQIMDSSQASSEALNVLHEKLGESLQTAVHTMSEEMQGALTTSIKDSMEPAMLELRKHATEQSTEVFESLVGKFAESFSEIGDKQAAQLEKSAQDMVSAVSEAAGTFESMLAKMRDQSAEYRAEIQSLIELSNQQRDLIRETFERLSTEFGTSTSKLEDAALNLVNSANAIESVSESFTAASTGFSENLETAAQALSTVTEQQRDASEIFWSQAEKLKELEEAVSASSSALGKSADSMTAGYDQMKERQEQFLTSLREHVAALEQQMSNWLGEYQESVSAQVTERMEEWNKHSQAYASNMLLTAQALQSVVEDIMPAVERVDRAVAALEAKPLEAADGAAPSVQFEVQP